MSILDTLASSTSPKIIFDGQGGIKLGPNANYVIVEGFEVEGPSQYRIDESHWSRDI